MVEQSDHPNRAHGERREEHKKSFLRSWRSSSPVSRLTLIFSGLAAVGGVAYALISAGQLGVMRDQLDEMRNARGQTERVITLTVGQTTAANRSANIAQRTFTESVRPFVGIFDVQKTRFDAAGAVTLDLTKAASMTFHVQLKNFGPLATNYVPKWRVFANDKEIRVRGGASNPATFFPGETSYFVGSAGPPYYEQIMNKKIIMSFEVTFSYDGPTQHYEYCEKRQYDPDVDGFIVLGACK